MPRKLIQTLAMLLATVVAGAATASTPPAIEPGEKPVAGSTEAELWYGVDQLEKELRASPVLVRDPVLNAYVREVACKVTREHCRDLRVYIINAPVFNASMAPNGAMLVFTGALLRMQDESELALVLGHEFAHFRQRHTLQYWVKAKRTSAWMASFSMAGLVGSVLQRAGLASMFDFTRDMEREADAIGFATASSMGYDPQAGVRLWTRMLAEEKANLQSKTWPIFASHPRTAERLEDVGLAARKAPAGDVRTERETYRKAMQPFLAAWLEAELSRRMYDTAIQVIGDLRASADPASAGTYTFFLAEAYRRRNKNDDMAHARKLYAEAVTLPDAPADAWREQGMALRADGKRIEAIDALRRYLELKPQAGDRAFTQKYISELETTP
jgi:predicted Zn-dependent protease